MTGNPQTISSKGQIAIAIKKVPGIKITYVSRFNANGNGREVSGFYRNGELSNTNNTAKANANDSLAGAIAIKFSLKAGEVRNIPIAFVYDFPKTAFGFKDASKKERIVYDKQYTKYFGNSGQNAVAIAKYALDNYDNWQTQIRNWQKTILTDNKLPNWFKGELINSLSLLQSGAVYWGNIPNAGNLHIMGESNRMDYRHTETRDVGIYAAARALLWPKLHNNLMAHYSRAIGKRDLTLIAYNEFAQKIPNFDKLKTTEQKKEAIYQYFIRSGKPTDEAKLLAQVYIDAKKIKDATPHDIGAPDSDPALDYNSYDHQNPNVWSELSMCVPLEAWRNFVLSGKKNTSFIQSVYGGVIAALRYAKRFDTKGLGLPIHLGIPDQTYDNWNVKGAMTYTSAMWLYALKAGIEMAKLMGDKKTEAELSSWYEKGKSNFTKALWNQKGYFNLSQNSTDVFSDVLPFLYGKISGLGEILPRNMLISHLQTIFKNNVANFGVRGFARGFIGAVNGTRNGKLINGEQEREVWLGSSYALGACLLAYGLKREGWQTVYGTYNLAVNQANNWGLWPEAYTVEPGIGNGPMYGYRARTYYRYLSIWQVYLVLKGNQQGQ
ncbi:MAG: hypothetical protein FD145_277 [Candidatus Saganbacteria bacterium]|uniref:Glycosyl-hydrolase family 116 catalytic region domain-containing protein n=1 Tax=Candidatus Saganbacteria bacterium TaxID=2575572 RepID=A0A833P3M2_UNCSA|nr:MAG: hypothetical protein FD145_277 [Candidatus Saganbacteria bacterium]